MSDRFSKGKTVKRICYSLLLTVILVGSAMAQWPVLSPDVLDTVQERKAEMFRYRRIQLAETMQTPNQEQYDVLYYDIDLAIEPPLEIVTGSVQMRATVVDGPIDHVEVDLLDNMIVSQVTVTGVSASFTHQNDLIDINLDRSYADSEIVDLTIEYSGNPEASGFGSFGFDSHAGKPMIWSLSEPFGARNWWPCKDQPSDKADSVDIRVTVPEDMIVASNGILRQVTDNGDTETYWWHEGYPIVTYLVSVAIYEYTVYSDYYTHSPTDSMEIQFYVFPDHLDNVQTTYAKTKQMLGIFSDLFGPYPFIEEKYGHAEFVWGGGMEHQTCTSLGGWSEALIAHEAAHQWWGDMITCHDFHHIWLNEGFATYSEALYWEQIDGIAAYFNDINNNKYFGSGTIYVPDLSSVGRIFHGGLSYNKASWVLHMLRHVVGDSTFFDILRAYYESQYQHGTAVTEDFQAICEAVSGMELGWFFQEWIYGEYYPVYAYCWLSVEQSGSYEVSLTIEQVQTNTGVFTMPIDVTFSAQGDEETVVVFNDLRTQTFEFDLDFSPTVVLLDRSGWILKTVIERAIELASPNGGEIWSVGETKTITWTSENTSGTVKIEYSTNGGSDWQTVASSTPDDGSYPWTIPNTPSTDCLVKICDTEHTGCCDRSNSTFTIHRLCDITIASPDGGENWCGGEQYDITWTSEGTSGNVKIEYSTDGGAEWQAVTESILDDGTHPWTIPSTLSTDCFVRICDAVDSECCGTSDSSFQICKCGTLEITTERFGDGTEGCPYSESVDVTGGCLPYTWWLASGQLPGGLDLEGSSGTISGEPNEVGTFLFTVTVSDDLGDSDEKDYSIQIVEYVNAKGDLNADCTADILDALLAVDIILELIEPTEDQIWRADCNGPIGNCDGDGAVDVLDVVKIVNLILGLDGCP